MMRIAREPLTHFLIVGLVFWLAAAHYRTVTDGHRIEVTRQTAERLTAGYRAEYGAAPSPARLEQLVDQYVTGEILYREGMARGLAERDEIVRRRVIQKTAFLEDGTGNPPAPTQAALEAWYRAHAADYAAPGRVRFSHVFFAITPGDEAKARARAAAVLRQLDPATVRAPDEGDPFPDLYDFTGFGPDEARRLFGDSEMATALFAAPAGRWSGPFRSAYGWHLVRVSAAEPGHAQPFEAVRGRVLADWTENARNQAGNRRMAALRARYTVVRSDR
ncbi:peptidyl-prolyl cis-trans isomerase [Novosphingobium beihaiensis]|uniref:Parvulin-like PPIase n=1 Tax=Novosphingobium beihaiensis TaxID=2930389 RepID=A0ABT0BLT9_9SPHN|nr:peptidylprolyl isomerase [Novosphingobium beihaiensis]MCJ2186026.1 peptidylprolyl isomerase [Novosphingobium beihaiensis]